MESDLKKSIAAISSVIWSGLLTLMKLVVGLMTGSLGILSEALHSALDLVAAGVGIALVSEECVRPCQGVEFLPVRNWSQALYMCILYDKWLEPPVWGFVEDLVQTVRRKEKEKQE